MPVYGVLGRPLPLAMVFAGVGAILALLGVGAGAGAVASAEANSRRPSGAARLAAGMGVTILGGAGGLMLGMGVLLHETAKTAAPAVTPKELDALTGPSMIVLTAMTALLVVGLGWCFYRAIRAGGAGAPEQLPEGTE